MFCLEFQMLSNFDLKNNTDNHTSEINPIFVFNFNTSF